MPSYKLQYFDARYLGETARLIFHYAGQKFEDERITHEGWINMKPDTLYGTIPILTIDNKTKLGQSMSIYHYLAKKFGLAGKNDEEIATVEDIGEYAREFMNKCLPFLLFDLLKEEGDREQKIKELLEVNIRLYLPTIVKLLKESKSEFFADSGLTWVDFFISEYIDSLNAQVPHLLRDFGDLLEHSKRVHNLPQLQDYLSKREQRSW